MVMAENRVILRWITIVGQRRSMLRRFPRVIGANFPEPRLGGVLGSTSMKCALVVNFATLGCIYRASASSQDCDRRLPGTEYKCGPRAAASRLRVDIFIALLAHSKAAFLDMTEGPTRASKLVTCTLEIRNGECAF
jgi:hypothetical protein